MARIRLEGAERERGGGRGVVFRFPESRHKEKKLPGRRYFRAVKFDTPATRPSSDFLGRGSERMNGRYFCMYNYVYGLVILYD